MKKRNTKKSVLFVCTTNVFRSVSAEYLLKKYLKKNGISGWNIGSAGTIARKESVDETTKKALFSMGVEKINHKQRKLSRELLNSYDIVIAMAQDHVDFIKEEFGFTDVFLFNELAKWKRTSIPDIQDIVPDYETNERAMRKGIFRTIGYINSKMPKLFANVSERFYLFSDLLDGKKRHKNSFPFIRLYETKNTVAFMSIDIPEKEDGHILVVPKNRYSKLEFIPDYVLKEIILSLKKIGKALDENHGGYNILLNNGKDAGQYIFHTHFHLVPRRMFDSIKMGWWRNRKLKKEEFVNLNKTIKNQIRK